MEECEVVEADRRIGVVGAEGFLADRQRSLVELLGLCVLGLAVVEACEVVEARRRIGVVGAEGLFLDRQSSLVERLRLGVLGLLGVEECEVVEARRRIKMVRADVLFCHRKSFASQDDTAVVLTRSEQVENFVVERLPLDTGPSVLSERRQPAHDGARQGGSRQEAFDLHALISSRCALPRSPALDALCTYTTYPQGHYANAGPRMRSAARPRPKPWELSCAGRSLERSGGRPASLRQGPEDRACGRRVSTASRPAGRRSRNVAARSRYLRRRMATGVGGAARGGRAKLPARPAELLARGCGLVIPIAIWPASLLPRADCGGSLLELGGL